MNRLNVLFVCSKNQWRSPTAETIYRDDQRIAVRSRGVARAARQTLAASDLSWAELVLVMEDKHRRRIVADYPGETKYLPVEVLHIPDDYHYMDEELISQLRSAIEPVLKTQIEQNAETDWVY